MVSWGVMEGIGKPGADPDDETLRKIATEDKFLKKARSGRGEAGAVLCREGPELSRRISSGQVRKGGTVCFSWEAPVGVRSGGSFARIAQW